MKNKNKNQRGFSLIETLFAVGIFILLALAISLFSRNTWVYNSFVTAGLNADDAARTILKTFTAEVRTASTADTGAYVISDATASSFTFYSDADNDGLKEKIRYFLSGTTFQKEVIKPSGSPLTYNIANKKTTTLVTNVTNSSIFDYYDKNYDGTTAALAFPVDVSSIRLVKISLTIDKAPNHSPTPLFFTTQVSIRNLKDNL